MAPEVPPKPSPPLPPKMAPEVPPKAPPPTGPTPLKLLSIVITNPKNDDEVAKTVEIRAETSGGKGKVNVEFFVGRSSIGYGNRKKRWWSIKWNTIRDRNGKRTLWAKATDSSQQTASDNVTVKVRNQRDSKT